MINTKKIIKLIIFSVASIMIVAVVSLLIAANDKNGNAICSGINVVVKGSEVAFDVEKDAFIKSIESSVVGSSIVSIDLPKMEKRLESHSWIEDAELYIDRKNILNISFKERTPIARVFTTNGNSFYLDAYGSQLPLLKNKSVPVHVVTGFTPAKKWNAADSSLFNEVKEVVGFISSNSFWNAQVGQIDITDSGFELVPLIGNHIIKIGWADGVEEKLNRAFLFYKKVLKNVGMNKYAAIDVQYANQIVAVKKETTTIVDEIQLQKNIEDLLKKKEMEANVDQQEEIIKPAPETLKAAVGSEDIKPLKKNSVPVKTSKYPITKSNSVNSTESKTSTEKVAKKKPVVNDRKPKAVMPKKVDGTQKVNN